MLRGQIWIVNLKDNNNSTQNGIRPMILVSNNLANLHSPVINAVPITTRSKAKLPTHVEIDTDCGIMVKSTVLCEQSMLIPKSSFIKCVGVCNQTTLNKINDALMIQFGLLQDKNKIYA